MKRFIDLPMKNICESLPPNFKMDGEFREWMEERFGPWTQMTVTTNCQRSSLMTFSFTSKLIKKLGKDNFRALLVQTKLRWG